MTTIATDQMVLHLVHAALRRKTFMSTPPLDLHATDFTIATCLRLSSFDVRNIILGNWRAGAQQMLLAVDKKGAPEITLRKYMRGQSIGGISFNNEQKFVEVTNVTLPGGSPVTIEFWMRPTGTCNGMVLFMNTQAANYPGRCYARVSGSDRRLWWNYGSGTSDGPDVDAVCSYAAIDPYFNVWTHVALVSGGKRGNFMGVYLNGKLAGAKNRSDGASPSVILFIGNKPGVWDTAFTGEVAEIRIWDHVRRNTEIQESMHRAPPPDAKGLVGYWPLDEGGGTVAHDRSSHGHHGDVSSGAQWVTEQTRGNDPNRPRVEPSADEILVSLSSQKALAAGAWHHLAVTFTWGADRKTPSCALYLDGVRTGQVSPSVAPSSKVVAPNVLMPSAEPYMLGWKQDSVDDQSYCDGLLHHLRVFKTALSPEEIAIMAFEDNTAPRGDDIGSLRQDG